MRKTRRRVGSGYNENLTINGHMGYTDEEGGRKAWRSGLGQIEES